MCSIPTVSIASKNLPEISAVSYYDVLLLKGLALLMMVFHHCFAVPVWYVDVPDFFQCDWWIVGGRVAKQCVGIFAFLSGWVYWHHQNKSWKYSVSKIISFLLLYWCAFALIAGIAYFFCSWRPELLSDVLRELFPVNLHPLMFFAWYVWFYIQMMLIFPLYHRIECLENRWGRWVCYITGLLVMVLLCSHFPVFRDLAWFAFVLLGYWVARRRVLEKIKQFLLRVNYGKTIIACFSIGLALILFLDIHMNSFTGRGPWCLLSPFFLVTGVMIFLSIYRMFYLRKLLIFFGKHSVNIWFLHSLFFSPETRHVMQKYFFVSTNPLGVYLSVLLFSLCLSIVLTPFQKWVQNMCRPIISCIKVRSFETK